MVKRTHNRTPWRSPSWDASMASVTKSATFYGTRRSTTVFTRASPYPEPVESSPALSSVPKNRSKSEIPFKVSYHVSFYGEELAASCPTLKLSAVRNRLFNIVACRRPPTPTHTAFWPNRNLRRCHALHKKDSSNTLREYKSIYYCLCLSKLDIQNKNNFPHTFSIVWFLVIKSVEMF